MFFMVDYLVVLSFVDQAIEFINMFNIIIEFFGLDFFFYNYILIDGYVFLALNIVILVVDFVFLIFFGCVFNQVIGCI